ncbi:MAG: TraB/GumN family protein [Proteobacteria bacterium]|nr:TraB/GumN family protein [Pseudomonadota bacterium]
MLALVVAAPSAFAQDVAATEEVVVTGERAGPELWRVTHGEHTLWLLGVLDPLPRRMTWRSAKVDNVVAQSERVLPARATVKVDSGFFAMIGLYFDWHRTERLPGDASLRSVLAPALYARYETLRRRFHVSDSADHLRPLVAARRLYEAALSISGLAAEGDVETAVIRTAKQHHVAIDEQVIAIQDPKGLLAELRAIPVEGELPCFEATVTVLERDLPALRERATAWALGDVETLRRTPLAEQSAACWDALDLSPRLRRLVDDALARREAAVLNALEVNRVALALVPVDRLLQPGGVLDRLREHGYTVEGP